jgi:hypothetical protein
MIATSPLADSQMHTVIMDVGPDLAAEWLEGNVHNRPIHQKRVDLYAADMKAGRWKLTHQGIAFDVNGILRDGQHRLWALLASGCTIRIPVTFNLSFDVIEEIDNVKARSVSDRMNISGRFQDGKISTNQVSVLRAMIRGFKPERPMAYHDECQLMQAHLPAIRFALERLTTTRIKGVSSPTVCAVVARAWYSQDVDRLERFCEILRTGIADNSEAVVILLRDYLSKLDRSATMSMLRDKHGRVERALHCFLSVRVVSFLRPCTSEMFPLPDEKEAAGL